MLRERIREDQGCLDVAPSSVFFIKGVIAQTAKQLESIKLRKTRLIFKYVNQCMYNGQQLGSAVEKKHFDGHII